VSWMAGRTSLLTQFLKTRACGLSEPWIKAYRPPSETRTIGLPGTSPRCARRTKVFWLFSRRAYTRPFALKLRHRHTSAATNQGSPSRVTVRTVWLCRVRRRPPGESKVSTPFGDQDHRPTGLETNVGPIDVAFLVITEAGVHALRHFDAHRPAHVRRTYPKKDLESHADGPWRFHRCPVCEHRRRFGLYAAPKLDTHPPRRTRVRRRGSRCGRFGCAGSEGE